MNKDDAADAKTRVTENFDYKPSETTEDALVHIYPTGPDLGRRYELSGKTANIGRDSANDISVNSDAVSRRHARLTIDGGRRMITDLQSTNGTYVNNSPILTQFLENGDQIKIGDTIFKYLVGNDVETSYHEEIYKMTIIDGLTGIHNKRYFFEALERELTRAQRHKRDLSIVMFDIDFFKKVNDTYGHLAGDYVLQSLAKLVSSRARREEIFARYGGEEFVILLPETPKDGAVELAERIRQRVAAYTFIFDGEEIPITVSLGVATIGDQPTDPTSLIKEVDQQLYRAKADGRNCVRG